VLDAKIVDAAVAAGAELRTGARVVGPTFVDGVCRGVRLETNGEGVRIEVTDDGIGASPGVNGGHGIVGMRERAQLLGGSFHAGPGPRGGYSVSAYLPVEEDSP